MLTDIVTNLDGRATTDDGLTFTIVFTEFNGGTGTLAFTEAESRMDEKPLRALASQRYSDMRLGVFNEFGWGAVPEPPKTLTQIVTELDQRAMTLDGLSFHIVFAEFNAAEGDLAFTATEAGMAEDDLTALAGERYGELRMQMFEEHGFTEGIV